MPLDLHKSFRHEKGKDNERLRQQALIEHETDIQMSDGGRILSYL